MTYAKLPPPHRHVRHTLAEIAEVLGHKTLATVNRHTISAMPTEGAWWCG
ncbi:MAG: hypothetical protein GY856_25710 [bacterium]|nr:hypothetical protein [bacterium]